MSSIDRISINRPEPDDFLVQERRRQLARQHQLESRETKRLVLPSVESQSRLPAKRALDDRRQSRGLTNQGSAAGSKTDGEYALEGELIGLARDIAGGNITASSEETADSRYPRFLDPQPASQPEDANAQPETDIRRAAKPAPVSIALQQEDVSEAAEAAYAGSIWLQRLNAAFAEARQTSSANAGHALEEVLDQLLHELQTHAAQSVPLPPDLKVALEALSSQRTAAYNANPDSDDHSRLQGTFRFFDAFVETMGSTPQAGRDPGAATDAMRDKAVASKASSAPENGATEAALRDSQTDRETIPPARDRQTLYEFLELLSRIAVSSTPIALQQLAQSRQASPEKALLRLAVSGDTAVALYAPEISRRFELISARVERDGRKSVRAGMLADEVAAQKQWMQSAIDEADSIVGYRALSLRAEREQQETNRAETMPQLILQKT